MKRHLLTIASLLLVAACQPKPTANLATGQDHSSNITKQDCPLAASGYRFLPGELEVPVAHHVRSDNIYTKKDGQQRRRIKLEFLDGDASTTLATVEKAMLDAGYAARPQKARSGGIIVARYTRTGNPAFVVTVDPNAGAKPNHPGAKGVLTYDYSVVSNQAGETPK